MITVHAKLFATLRRYRPELKIGAAFPVELPTGATVRQLIERLGVPVKEVKVVFVNNIIRDTEHVLVAEDKVGIFPAVGGG